MHHRYGPYFQPPQKIPTPMLNQYRLMHWYEMFRDGCIALKCSEDRFSNNTELFHPLGSIIQKRVGCGRFLINLYDDLGAHTLSHLVSHS